MYKYFISFCVVFHYFYALTLSFTNNYHQLLWILQYCLGNLLYVIFTGFWPISREIHHNWWQVRKDLRDVILWRRWQEKGLVNSWAVTVLIKAFLNQKLHRDIKSYKVYGENISDISKARRPRPTSKNTEDSRALRVQEPPHIYFLSVKLSTGERLKETGEGRAEVGRPPCSWVGLQFPFYGTFSRVYIVGVGPWFNHPIHYQGDRM